jgi:hypothetical protein
MGVPLLTNPAANGAGCPAWFRNVEPIGRRQAGMNRIVASKIVVVAFFDGLWVL